MKIILLQHVKGIGRKGEVTEVSDGYAQNALIPKGLAKVATSSEINKLEQSHSAALSKKEKEEKEIIEALNALNGKSIIIKEKLNEKGTLYQTLGLKDIIKAIKNQLGKNITEEVFVEKYALKEKGEYTLELAHNNTLSNIHLEIKDK